MSQRVLLAGRFARSISVAIAGCWLAGAVILATITPAAAKAPGRRHCHGDVCHRVLTLAQTAAETGKVRQLYASHYDDCRRDRYNPCGLTSSGEVFRPDAPDNAASAIHPDGTILLLHNPETDMAAVVRVNNFGPFWGNRKLDVSRATAHKLGFGRRGVAKLDVMVVYTPTVEETRYKRRRRYEPVAGYLGHMTSIEHAFLAFADARDRQRTARLADAACRIGRPGRAPKLATLTVRYQKARPHA